MTSIAITELDPGRFGVEVQEGDHRTGHVVIVPDAFVDGIGLPEVDPTLVVRESVGFLLDREPSTSIGEEFSLGEISRRYPDYYDELRARLTTG